MPRICSITSQLLLGAGQNRLYFITPNTTSINEGSSVTFTINTTNVQNGTILYWTTKPISGDVNATDFTDGNLSGVFTINNGTATITRTLTSDLLEEGQESFALEIRIDSISGSIRATSATVTINDTSVPTYAIVPNITSVNESGSVSFTVSTTGVANGTTLYWTTLPVSGLITVADFTDNTVSGSFTINNNSGSIVRGITADNLTEGTESFRLQIRTGSTGGDIRATSSIITINDTSLSQPPTLLAWGAGDRVGDNTTVNRSSPVSVVGEITDWTQIATSSSAAHSLALRSNGVLYAWGVGGSGRLGESTTVNRSSPIIVAGGITNWEQISAGSVHSSGLRSDGTIWSWGSGGNGQLGTGNYVNRSIPVREGRSFTDWVEIAAGGTHSIARRADGRLWAWGSNSFGKLGVNYSFLVTRNLPTLVAGTITDWTKIAAGVTHNLALRSNGTVWAWGDGALGRLGTGNLISRSSPVQITGGITNWTQISAGRAHSIARRADGTLWAWGDNNDGQLGNNSFFRRSSPVPVAGGFTDWSQIAAGSYHNLALRSNGTVWSWGRGSIGQLGDNNTTLRQSPVQITGGITTWTKIAAGSIHNIALRTT